MAGAWKKRRSGLLRTETQLSFTAGSFFGCKRCQVGLSKSVLRFVAGPDAFPEGPLHEGTDAGQPARRSRRANRCPHHRCVKVARRNCLRNPQTSEFVGAKSNTLERVFSRQIAVAAINLMGVSS